MTQIPQPPPLPVLGNVGDVDSSNTSKSFGQLAEIYGPVFRLNLMGRSVVVVGSYDVAKELFDERRFLKKPAGGLLEVRNGVGDGLFTAYEEEHNWGLAHKLLMPSFGPMAIRNMYDEMHEIACQLTAKWAREGPDSEIDPTVDFTKLTLDSIALCAMGTRFNSFFRETMHPFPIAMAEFLAESGQRSLRPKFVSDYVYRASTRKYWENINSMKAVTQQAIDERRRHPSDKKDLLNAMLLAKDPKTGEMLSEEAIMNNAITFLIAGHETTSGMLSFLFILLIQSPAAMRAAQEEVDRVIGTGPITADHMGKLPYIAACLRETLRLWPTASIIGVTARSEDESDYPMFLGKKQYQVNKGEGFALHLPTLHRDPEVYPDPDSFKPERMLDDNFNKLPAGAWKPFGNGARACIGRAFAWQEAILAVAMLLQNFTFYATDPQYKIDTKSTLTIKPADFTMHAVLRSGLDPISLERRLWGGRPSVTGRQQEESDKRVEDASKIQKSPMAILYGSNTGTCEALANALANSASTRGYEPVVKPMDAGTEELAKSQPVIIITASYEGEPPDNAGHFVEWMKSLEGSALKDAKFAVFGCGNHDWVTTFHKIPKLTDEVLEKRGATRIAELGTTDVALGRIFDDFDTWTDNKFWPGMEKIYGEQKSTAGGVGLEIELEPGSRAADLRHDVREGLVLENKRLTAAGEPEKKEISIQLPSGVEYSTGDYLAVLPVMPSTVVKRVMARFNIPWDARVTVKEGQHTTLPTGKSLAVFALLSAYVELNLPCTQKNIATLASCIEDEKSRKELESTTADDITGKRISVLDLLEKYPSCLLPFSEYLGMLSPLRVRQYSISSSPLHSRTTCTLTYSVLDEEAKVGGKRYQGAASNYLADLSKGDTISVSVRQSHQAFHPPADVENVPVIMICAGTGLAPFHGFVQERAKQMEAGRTLAPALLFMGCRGPGRDDLYAKELQDLQKQGAVDVRYAYSQATEKSEGCKYVQDRLWKDRKDASKLYSEGGRMYVCGNGAVGEAVKDVFVKTVIESSVANGKEVTEEQAETYFHSIRNERFASDVFA